MKVLFAELVLAAVSFEVITALRCMQGIEVSRNGVAREDPMDTENLPEMIECGLLSTAASTLLLLAVKPSTTLGRLSGNYSCYHLTARKPSKSSATIKGCIYSWLNVCDGQLLSENNQEMFCSQCKDDGCNSGERFQMNWTLLFMSAAVLYFGRGVARFA